MAAALPAALAPDGGLPLALPLSARLLVEPPLAKLRVEPRTLNLALEAPESSLQALAFLNGYFQDNCSSEGDEPDSVAVGPRGWGGWASMHRVRREAQTGLPQAGKVNAAAAAIKGLTG